MKNKIKKFLNTGVFQCIVIALVLDIILETLGRHSLIDAFKYMFSEPLVFLYNCSIIFLTLTLALLMRKRLFGYGIISFVWLLCGVTNCVVLGFRITPFSAVDFLMARNTITIIDKYFSVWQIVLIVAALIIALVGIIVLFLKSPTIHGNIYRIRTTVFIVATYCMVMLFTRIALNSQTISDNFANLATAYDKYGFVYCFSNSVVDVGISEPDDYSEEYMLEIKEELDEVEASGAEYADDSPNIIIVQLESFMDPSYVKGLSFSENPIPNFTALKEECTSGFLTMPAIGAGTANSEFEVLSGFNVAYFGAGEYPYKTILSDTTCETIATQLKSLGYSTHAIHNHDGTFYDRYTVYDNLGFDTFTPMEYMYNVETTQKNWEKDNVLTEEIMKALTSTDEQDFVFTVSVQGHGRYPDELDYENYDYPITVTGTGDEALDTEWTYYCNQLYEMDQFIGDLIEELEDYDEEVILVMYGDHLPGFDFEEDDLENGNLYQTEYFIWSNIDGFAGEDEDLYAYELGNKLFDMTGFEKTYLQKFLTIYSEEDEEFDDIMSNIEYDMLYGERYLYPDGWPYEPTDMQYGIDPIYITGIEEGTYILEPEETEEEEDTEDSEETESEELSGYYITGENFNECTFVWIDDKYVKTTIYIDRNTLFVYGVEFEDGEEVAVAQVGDDNIDFGASEAYIYNEE